MDQGSFKKLVVTVSNFFWFTDIIHQVTCCAFFSLYFSLCGALFLSVLNSYIYFFIYLF